MDASIDVDTGSSSGAVDLRVTPRDDVSSGDVISCRPLNLTLSGLPEAEEKSARCFASTPPDTPTSPAASAFKKSMLKRYSTWKIYASWRRRFVLCRLCYFFVLLVRLHENLCNCRRETVTMDQQQLTYRVMSCHIMSTTDRSRPFWGQICPKSRPLEQKKCNKIARSESERYSSGSNVLQRAQIWLSQMSTRHYTTTGAGMSCCALLVLRYFVVDSFLFDLWLLHSWLGVNKRIPSVANHADVIIIFEDIRLPVWPKQVYNAF